MPETQTPQEATRTRASEKLPIILYIQKSDMERYGYTETCKGCRAQQAGLRPQSHSDMCRQRIKQAVRGDATPTVRVEQFDHRQNVGLAEHIQQEAEKSNDNANKVESE